MSACNGFVTPTASYLFTDAAVCDPNTFKVLAFLSKVAHIPHCGAAISATGNAMVTSLFGSTLAQRDLRDFDDLVSQSLDALQKCIRDVEALPGATKHVFENFRIGIAGWSPKANAPAFYSIQSNDGIGIKPFELLSCDKFINPAASHENDRSIIDLNFEPKRPAESGLAIVRAQRKMKCGQYYAVGGWAQMTTVTRDGISTRILEKWPDKIGQRIVPTAPVPGSLFSAST